MSVVEIWKKQLGIEHQTEQDGTWLRLFVQQHDGDAFAGIVRRHAAMVHAICRRVLGNVADAEDASQATFLILAKRAHTIRQQNDVGAWLFGVARRVALQLLRHRQRREAREKRVAIQPNSESNDLLVAHEVALLCDAELLRLPLRYRQALVLCCIEGLPKSLAARRLGWPEGTVASCVSRGKKLLAKRLIRRGVLPALAAAVLSTPVVQAIPASLGNISASALALLSGRSLVSLALPGAIQLLHEVHSTMFQRRLLYLACSTFLICTVPGLLWGWHLVTTPRPEQGIGTSAATATTPQKPETDQERIQGRWKLVAIVSHDRQANNPFNRAIGSILEFKGNQYIQIDADNNTEKAPRTTFRLNELVQPHELDTVFDNTYTIPGLYSLDADTLVICTSQKADARPVEISASRNGTTKISIYRRVVASGVATAEDVRTTEEQLIAKVGRNLRACLIAMHNYHQDYFRLPSPAIFDKTTGKALLSWRVQLLPYLDPVLENDALYKQFNLNEPWDSEHNKKLISKMPAVFSHPGTATSKEFKTHYRVFVAPAKIPNGKKNLFAPCFTLAAESKTPTLGQMTVADGTSNTIAIVEATDAVVWTKPDELVIEHDEAPIPSLGAIASKHYFVAMHFDGTAGLYKGAAYTDDKMVIAKEWHNRLLRQLIGWKDGINNDITPIKLR